MSSPAPTPTDVGERVVKMTVKAGQLAPTEPLLDRERSARPGP